MSNKCNTLELTFSIKIDLLCPFFISVSESFLSIQGKTFCFYCVEIVNTSKEG